MSSAKTVSTKAQASLKRLRTALGGAAKHAAKEESIHDLRVSIRRFKQVLRVYADSFEHTKKMRRSLRGLMELCGAARNCDVAMEVLEAAGMPAHHKIKTALAKRRKQATRNLARELEDFDESVNFRHWRHWLTPRESGAAPAASPELSREFFRSGRAAAAAQAGYRQMHQFRLLVKRTRYTSEILGAAESRLEGLRALQDRLGAINDCVTTGELIAELKLAPSEQRRIRAALNRLAAKRSGEFRVYWRRHYGRRVK